MLAILRAHRFRLAEQAHIVLFQDTGDLRRLSYLRILDTFKLYVLGETLTYEVDQIRIVLPDELNDLKIEEGQDYCTLITCTPYGVNSHRLLIRGHRIANDAQGLIVEDVKQVQPLHEAIVLGILFLVLYIIICKILSKTILYRFR